VYEIPILGWRVQQNGKGAYLWFEVEAERVKLFRVLPYEQQEMFDEPLQLGTLDKGEDPEYLDKVSSVSATEAEARVGSNDKVNIIEPPVEWLSFLWEGGSDGS